MRVAGETASNTELVFIKMLKENNKKVNGMMVKECNGYNDTHTIYI